MGGLGLNPNIVESPSSRLLRCNHQSRINTQRNHSSINDPAINNALDGTVLFLNGVLQT
jgi:hypothetical protein